jgi:hypothetical protein
VDAVWLSPWYPSPMPDAGHDAPVKRGGKRTELAKGKLTLPGGLAVGWDG